MENVNNNTGHEDSIQSSNQTTGEETPNVSNKPKLDIETATRFLQSKGLFGGTPQEFDEVKHKIASGTYKKVKDALQKTFGIPYNAKESIEDYVARLNENVSNGSENLQAQWTNKFEVQNRKYKELEAQKHELENRITQMGFETQANQTFTSMASKYPQLSDQIYRSGVLQQFRGNYKKEVNASGQTVWTDQTGTILMDDHTGVPYNDSQALEHFILALGLEEVQQVQKIGTGHTPGQNSEGGVTSLANQELQSELFAKADAESAKHGISPGSKRWFSFLKENGVDLSHHFGGNPKTLELLKNWNLLL